MITKLFSIFNKKKTISNYNQYDIDYFNYNLDLLENKLVIIKRDIEFINTLRKFEHPLVDLYALNIDVDIKYLVNQYNCVIDLFNKYQNVITNKLYDRYTIIINKANFYKQKYENKRDYYRREI